IAGLQFDLEFDSSKIQVESVSEGMLLRQNGASTFFNDGNIDNNAGTLSDIYGLVMGPSSILEPESFASITMSVKEQATSTSAICLKNVIISDPSGNPIDVLIKNTTLIINKAPVAVANGPSEVNEGDLIPFDGSASSDPEGAIVSYNWDFGDGNTGIGKTTTHTYTSPNTYTVTLRVTDNYGLTDTDTATVTVEEAPSGPQEVFYDSFEQGEWNGLWTEDNQRDWYDSTQRAIDGRWSAGIDGRATNAALTSKDIDMSGKTTATITFSWYIENYLDKGEYLAFDVSTDGGATWTEKAILRGNIDTENTWHEENIEVNDINSLKIQFRGKMSNSQEDAFVDMVRVVAK
ncbi:PKD domain-containing protein, partial [Methanococcoides sp. SA1]|nr:PKD domain-containing protein [Methanococcoides sp. SA1]